jgi:hypothetical protein
MKTTLIPAPESGSQFTKKISSLSLAFAIAIVAILSSCESEDIAPAKPVNPADLAASPTAGGSPVAFTSASTFGTLALDAAGQVYHARNFFQGTPGTGSNPHVPNSTYYYDFAINDGGTSTSYVVQFGGTANGDITVASGYTMGYTTTAFASVTTSTPVTTVTTFGYNNIVFANPSTWSVNSVHPGWYEYNIVSHTVFPLNDSGRDVVTLVITNTSTGAKIKFRPIDLYQNGTPAGGPPPNNYPYLDFEYDFL